MSSTNALHQAIIDQDMATIKKILQEEDNWDPRDHDGETVLHLVFKCKYRISLCQDAIVEILECLLSKGLSVNLKNASGRTVLFEAVENRLQHVTVFLVQHGANVNIPDENGNTIVHLLIEHQSKNYPLRSPTFQKLLEQDHRDSLTRLLSIGVNVHLRNNDGKSAFDLAIQGNLIHILPILIKHMKDVDYIVEDGSKIIKFLFLQQGNITPIYDVEILDSLLVFIDHVDKTGTTLVHMLLKWFGQNPDITLRILQSYSNVNARDQDGNTALYLVIQNNKHTIYAVRTLLCKGANVNLKNHIGDTAVHLTIRLKRFDVLQVLLEYGADINQSTHAGASFLHHISSVPSVEDEKWAPMIDTLVRAGWDVNAVRPDDKFTPLMVACRSICPAIAQKLIANGANVNMKDNAGETAVCFAIRIKHFDMLKVLLEYGADLSPSGNPGASFLHDISSVPSIEDEVWAPTVDTLVRVGWNVNAVRRDDGFTPLMLACRFRCLAIAQKLIDYGANVNFVEKHSLMRPIHIAAMNGYANQDVITESLIKMLVKAGAMVNVKNNRGETALHLAMHCDYSTVIQLMKFGAHVDARDDMGCSPLQKATGDGNVAVIETLLHYGAEVNDAGVLRELNNVMAQMDREIQVLPGVFVNIVNHRKVATVDELTKHWLKLKAASLPAIDGYADFAKTNSLQDFYVDCLKEVETLKTHHIIGRTTLYDVLRMNVHVKYISIIRKLKKLVVSPSLKTDFPEYHNVIIAHYNKAVTRYPLIGPAKRAWDVLTGIRLPDCVEQILVYLDNENLCMMAGEEESENLLKRPSKLTLGEPTKRKRLQ